MTTPSSDNLFAGVLKGAAQPATAETTAAPADANVAAPATAPAVEPVADDEAQAPAPTMTQLDMLKNRARLMGISFSNNIGLEALKAKIDAKMSGQSDPEQAAPAQPEPVATQPTAAASASSNEAASAPATTEPAAKPMTLRQQMIAEQMKLVRLRITNLDPKKKDLHGEIFTFGNKILGTVRKFIPYGEQTDNGFHVPYCIYQELKARQFLDVKVRKVKGREVVETRYVREFALEELPQLTKEELNDLKAAQAAAGSVD